MSLSDLEKLVYAVPINGDESNDNAYCLSMDVNEFVEPR